MLQLQAFFISLSLLLHVSDDQRHMASAELHLTFKNTLDIFLLLKSRMWLSMKKHRRKSFFLVVEINYSLILDECRAVNLTPTSRYHNIATCHGPSRESLPSIPISGLPPTPVILNYKNRLKKYQQMDMLVIENNCYSLGRVTGSTFDYCQPMKIKGQGRAC